MDPPFFHPNPHKSPKPQLLSHRYFVVLEKMTTSINSRVHRSPHRAKLHKTDLVKRDENR